MKSRQKYPKGFSVIWMAAVVWVCVPWAARAGQPASLPPPAVCFGLNAHQDPVCGDGLLERGEQCDDGNQNTELCDYGQTSCKVCATDCTLQSGATTTCGDGVLDTFHGEQCDDGNTSGGDGCSALCLLEPRTTCGNLSLEADEQCDCQDKTLGCTLEIADVNPNTCSKTATRCDKCQCSE